MTRRKRCIPSERERVQLTPRDLLILEAIARCQFLSSLQVARTYFTSHDRALHRLRQLIDARYLNATMLASREPNLLSCTRRALDALVDDGVALGGVRLPSPVRASAVPHLVLTNDLRLYSASLNAAGFGELLEWNVAELGAARGNGLRPDATVAIRLGRTEGTVYAEIDCGHEGADLQDKLNRYGKLLPRPTTELWIVAAGNAKRLDEVARMCRRAQVDRSTRLFAVADINTRPTQPPVPKLFRKFEQQEHEDRG